MRSFRRPVGLGRGNEKDMGDCQNYGPFLGTLNTWCRIIIGIPKGTINLTTTHIETDSLPRVTQGLGFRA